MFVKVDRVNREKIVTLTLKWLLLVLLPPSCFYTDRSATATTASSILNLIISLKEKRRWERLPHLKLSFYFPICCKVEYVRLEILFGVNFSQRLLEKDRSIRFFLHDRKHWLSMEIFVVRINSIVLIMEQMVPTHSLKRSCKDTIIILSI